MASESLLPTAMGLAAKQGKWSGLDLVPSVVNTLQSARAPSTMSTYDTRWHVFCQWCGEQGVAPESCRIKVFVRCWQGCIHIRYTQQPFQHVMTKSRMVHLAATHS